MKTPAEQVIADYNKKIDKAIEAAWRAREVLYEFSSSYYSQDEQSQAQVKVNDIIAAINKLSIAKYS